MTGLIEGDENRPAADIIGSTGRFSDVDGTRSSVFNYYHSCREIGISKEKNIPYKIWR